MAKWHWRNGRRAAWPQSLSLFFLDLNRFLENFVFFWYLGSGVFGILDGCKSIVSSISHFHLGFTILSLTHLISELQGRRTSSLAPEALLQGISIVFFLGYSDLVAGRREEIDWMSPPATVTWKMAFSAWSTCTVYSVQCTLLAVQEIDCASTTQLCVRYSHNPCQSKIFTCILNVSKVLTYVLNISKVFTCILNVLQNKVFTYI